MSDTEDEGFIGLPPGMTAPVDSNSGTVRRGRPERSRSDRDDVVFFPTVPGAPPIRPSDPLEGADEAVPPRPIAAPEAGEPSADVAHESTVDDATSFSVPRHGAPVWRLVIPGREPIAVEGSLYLGRNPVAGVDHPQAGVLAVQDAAKSVSKTHALLELDATGLWVHDLESTNGVWVVPAGRDAIEVEPGQRVAVPPGADLELGDLVIQVERG